MSRVLCRDMDRARYVLDTGAFLSRMHPTDGPLYSIPGVKEEIRPKAALRYFEQLEASGTLSLEHPSSEARARIIEEARTTGDMSEMSQVDQSLLALAYEFKAILVTSDHRMQNVATALKIEFLPLTEGKISKQWQWTWRCTGCGRYFEDEGKLAGPDCPVCGSSVRKRRKK